MPTTIVLNLLGFLPVFLFLPLALPIKPPNAERSLDAGAPGRSGGEVSEFISEILPFSNAASALAI